MKETEWKMVRKAIDFGKNPNWTILRDALYYLDVRSGASVEQARGVLVGTSAVLMAMGIKRFQDVWRILIPLMPEDFRTECIPPCWIGSDGAEFALNLTEIIPYSSLYESLKNCIGEDKAREVRLDLINKYLYLVGHMDRECRRLGDGCEVLHRASLTPFRQYGSQSIAECVVIDRTKRRIENQYNWHGQNTSQWLFGAGLLVQNGRVSIHT